MNRFFFAIGLVSFLLDRTLLQICQPFAEWPIVEIFNRSFFEGLPLGMSDIPVLCFLLWIAVHLIRKRYSHVYFIIGSSLSIAATVHLTKGIVGRKRPSSGDMFDFEFFNGWGVGSFPSGHTAMIASLLLFSVLLPRWRTTIAALSVILIIIMSVSRMAVGAHWFSDTVWSVIISIWIIQAWKKRITVV